MLRSVIREDEQKETQSWDSCRSTGNAALEVGSSVFTVWRLPAHRPSRPSLPANWLNSKNVWNAWNAWNVWSAWSAWNIWNSWNSWNNWNSWNIWKHLKHLKTLFGYGHPTLSSIETNCKWALLWRMFNYFYVFSSRLEVNQSSMSIKHLHELPAAEGTSTR